MGIRILTDSSADFELSAAKRREIRVVPLAVQFGGASFLDGKTITQDLFYKLLQERKENPSTSQPSPADFLRFFEEAKTAGDQIVAILLSGELSGTLQSALIAKEMCGYDPIYIVDSRSATAGMQILVNYACKLRDSGLPAPEIAAAVERIKTNIRIFAAIDTLEYLRRGGRLTALQAGLGTVAKLKPVIAVREGKVSVVSKALGMGAAVKQMVKLMQEHPVDDAYPSYFLYSDDESRDKLLLPKLKEQNMLPLRLHRCSVGPTIGTHIGPGALGMAYMERAD